MEGSGVHYDGSAERGIHPRSEGLREFNERMEVPSESSAVSEGVLRCIREMKKEGIDREVIMRVMEASFHVRIVTSSQKQLKRSEVKKELYR